MKCLELSFQLLVSHSTPFIDSSPHSFPNWWFWGATDIILMMTIHGWKIVEVVLANMWTLPTIVTMLAIIVVLNWTRFSNWFHAPKLKEGQAPLPPGDFGWPIIGNMPHFLFAFKIGYPQSFIGRYISRYGRGGGVYRCVMFGEKTVLATTAETCKAVLMAEEGEVVETGWPVSTCKLMGQFSFTSLPPPAHQRLRRLTAAAFNGHATLSSFFPVLCPIITRALSSWSDSSSSSSPLPLLPRLKKLTFHIIAKILMGFELGEECDAVEKFYTNLNLGMRAMAINLPGTAYNRALKARRALVKLLQEVIDKRRQLMEMDESKKWNDVLELLIVTPDEEGRTLRDEEIIDLLVMYLNAGHESSAHSIMWILIYLTKYPQYFKRVKEEQLEIRKAKQGNKELTFDDYRNMKYLSQVIDEMLRITNISPMVFRRALRDLELNGYTIPKGWRIQTWLRQVHLDPEVYNEPLQFNPDRWERITPKPGTFIPFGAGVHMCPGNEFAKLEISIFIHYAVLDYRFEPLSLNSPTIYLPHPRPKNNFLVHIYKNESF